MTKRFFFLLAASLLAGACQPPDTEDGGRPSAGHPSAGRIALHFEVLENFEAGGFRAALTLTNHRAAELAAEGWELYFNFNRAFAQESLPAGIAVSHVNGDFFRLEPTAEFEPLPPGESRRIEFEGRDWVVRETDAPAGPYFVFRGTGGQPRPPVPAQITVAAFETPEQTRRSAADRMAVPTPESRHEQGDALSLLPAVEVGPIVPTPVRLHPGTGSVTVDDSWEIHHGAGLEREAAFLARALEPLLGATPATAPGAGAAASAIVLEIDEAGVAGIAEPGAGEAYRLTIDPAAGIRITGSGGPGVFYGISSLRALVPVDGHGGDAGPIELPAITVEDAPRFAYRGMHLDVARNFQGKDAVLELLDLMAFYKLNRFHFHLSDDEGWRLQVAGLPELTEVGARRGHTTDERDRLVPSFGSGPDPEASHGSGHYTREDYAEILRYARDRHIRVIPEFDFPGHARAAIKAMDARHARLTEAEAGDAEAAAEFLLVDPGDESEYRSVQGWTDNVVDACLESTYRFLETVVEDVVAIHAEAGAPLEVFHTGGDEVPGGVWEGSPACRLLIEDDVELDDAGDLAPYFLRRLSEILDRHDLVTAGWEEIALEAASHDGSAAKVPNEEFAGRFRPYVWNSVWGWGSEDVAYRLANAGYRVVLSNASNLYFDLAYEKHPEEPGYDWAGFTDTRQPWELVPLDLFKAAREDKLGRPIDPETAYADAVRLTAEGRSNVLGIQGQLWGENALGPERMEYLAFPKLLGLAERAWASEPEWAATADREERRRLEAAAWNEFANRLGQRELPRLDVVHGGVGYRLPPPGAVIEDGQLHANVAFPGLAVRFTTDGSEPTVDSELYAGPVAVSGTVRLKTFDSRGRGSRTSVMTAE